MKQRRVSEALEVETKKRRERRSKSKSERTDFNPSINEAKPSDGFTGVSITNSSDDGKFRRRIDIQSIIFQSIDADIASCYSAAAGGLVCEGSASYSALPIVVALLGGAGLRLGLFSPIPNNSQFSRRRSRFTLVANLSMISVFPFHYTRGVASYPMEYHFLSVYLYYFNCFI